jgi:hypothetical protein
MIAQDQIVYSQPFLFEPPAPVIADGEREYFPTPELIAEFAISTFSTGGRMVLDAGAGAGVWGLTSKRLQPNRFVVGVDVPGVKPISGYSFWFSKGFELAALRLARVGIQFDDAIGNPPFSKAVPFIDWTWSLLRPGGRLIYFLRLGFLAGQERARYFWSKYPIRAVSVSSQRPSFTGDGVSDQKTDYAIVVLEKGYTGPQQLLPPFIYEDRTTWSAPQEEFNKLNAMLNLAKSANDADQVSNELLEKYLVDHYPGVGGTLAKQVRAKELPYTVPEVDLIEAARAIRGWSLHSWGSRGNAEGRVVTRLEFKHRSGFTFPNQSLKLEGVHRVNSYVAKGTATVWVTWKAEPLI